MRQSAGVEKRGKGGEGKERVWPTVTEAVNPPWEEPQAKTHHALVKLLHNLGVYGAKVEEEALGKVGTVQKAKAVLDAGHAPSALLALAALLRVALRRHADEPRQQLCLAPLQQRRRGILAALGRGRPVKDVRPVGRGAGRHLLAAV